jgi:hypothetical protein
MKNDNKFDYDEDENDDKYIKEMRSKKVSFNDAKKNKTDGAGVGGGIKSYSGVKIHPSDDTDNNDILKTDNNDDNCNVISDENNIEAKNDHDDNKVILKNSDSIVNLHTRAEDELTDERAGNIEKGLFHRKSGITTSKKINPHNELSKKNKSKMYIDTNDYSEELAEKKENKEESKSSLNVFSSFFSNASTVKNETKVCTCIYAHACTYLCVYIYLCIYVCVYVYIYIYICIYIYIYIYIYTYIYIPHVRMYICIYVDVYVYFVDMEYTCYHSLYECMVIE